MVLWRAQIATFVLVHGDWHGSWCWKRVRKSLQQRGHEVFTPTLTGLGERSHLLAQSVNLQTHTMDVLNLIQWEELTDVILCGHSYGGMCCWIASRFAPPSPRFSATSRDLEHWRKGAHQIVVETVGPVAGKRRSHLKCNL
jgi:pimeloyl-ACP methyl ester carboxylesterase